MPFSTTVSSIRTTQNELHILNTLKNTMEEKCGFPFVRTGPKTRQYAILRQTLAYTASKHNVRTSHIAAFLGYSSHQSVIHAIKLIDGLISYDKNIQQLCKWTENELEYRQSFGILAQQTYEI